MKLGKFILGGLFVLSLTFTSQAQLRLPSPEQALSSPGMEKMAGILFSRRFESGSLFGKPDILAPDHESSKRVQKIVSRLAESVAMDRPNVVFQAKVVKQDDVNAFCIPGGYIYVYTGLLEHIEENHPENPDDALAAVLGHEIAHAVLRHGLKDWSQSKEFKKILDDPEVFQQVLMASSREQEFEADRYGALYALRAGFKMTAAADVFDKFPKSRAIYDRGLSSHPTGEERVAQLKKFEKQMNRTIGLWDESFKASTAGRYDQASVALEILEAEFPNLPSVHNNLGWTYYRLYEKTDPTPLQEHPAYSFVEELGVKVRGADGDTIFLKEAQDEFRKALSLNPDMVEAYEGSALCALENENYEAAGTALERALALKPERPEALNLLGILSGRKGDQEQAEGHFQACIHHDNEFAPAHFNLARVYQKLGMGPKAQASFQAYLELEPTGHWAKVASESVGQSLAANPTPKPSKLGPVELGQPRDAIIESLGPPVSEVESFTQLKRMDYPKSGLTVWLEDGEVQMISSRRSSPQDVDVKLGQSEQEVRSALGRPLKSGLGEGGVKYWSYPAQGLSVLFEASRVVGFTLGQ